MLKKYIKSNVFFLFREFFMFKLNGFSFFVLISLFCIFENRCNFSLVESLDIRFKIIKFKAVEDLKNLQFYDLGEDLARKFVPVFLNYADWLSKFADVYESKSFKTKKNKNEFNENLIPLLIIENPCFFMFNPVTKKIVAHVVFNSTIEAKNKDVRKYIEAGYAEEKDVLDFYGSLDLNENKNKQLLSSFLDFVLKKVKEENRYIEKFVI
jgi:hypothetical protein